LVVGSCIFYFFLNCLHPYTTYTRKKLKHFIGITHTPSPLKPARKKGVGLFASQQASKQASHPATHRQPNTNPTATTAPRRNPPGKKYFFI